jgi:uncharacterized membrane protein YeiH
MYLKFILYVPLKVRRNRNTKQNTHVYIITIVVTIIISIINRWSLDILRLVLLDLEDASGLSIFVLTYPDHGVRSDDAGNQ